MDRGRRIVMDFIKTVCGCAVFALGFDLFLLPNQLNAGGISGLAMIIVYLTDIGTIGSVTAVVNLPLFVLAGVKIGRKFFLGSLLGMLLSSTFIDLFATLPHPAVEPLMGALYGGAFCGLGLGIVLSTGGSTGGSDIIVRLVNSGVAIFVAGRVIDAVVYSFDYSRVALVISKNYEGIASAIAEHLARGVTFLEGQGYYTRTGTKVILTAVKRQQLAELKSLVVGIDPDAFIIVQGAHQVLGDGFIRYSKDSL